MLTALAKFLARPAVADRLIRRAKRTPYTHIVKNGEYHAITEVSPGGVWTLFVTFRYRGTWGFLVDGVKVKWRTYLGIDK